MATGSTSRKNAGYILIMLPQLLLIAGVACGFTWLSILFFFLLLPLLRYLVGNDYTEPNGRQASRLLQCYFKSLPRIYCLSWACVLPWSAWVVGSGTLTTWGLIGFMLSLWTVFSLTTAIAHELAHTVDSKLDRCLGRLLNASVGYFHFAEEHLTHHIKTGHHHGGDMATPGESIYRYSWKRFLVSFQNAWEFERGRLGRRAGSGVRNRLIWRAGVPLLVACMFYHVAGARGLLTYLIEVAGAAFAVQAITYIQHWGMSERTTPEQADFGFSWEDGCWMQACVTLNNAYHGQHHLYMHKPYYQLRLTKDAAILPASYPVMFVLALYPSLFTRIMQRRLALWRANKDQRASLMHRCDCIGAAALSRSASDQGA